MNGKRYFNEITKEVCLHQLFSELHNYFPTKSPALQYTSAKAAHTYLLHGAECFWEANRFAASQEIPRISRNPKVHYRTHKRPPSVPILGQPNPVHIPTSHLLEIRPYIIHLSTPRSPHWSLSLQFPHQDPIHPLLLTHTRHMPSPSHSSPFYHPHNIPLQWANTALVF